MPVEVRITGNQLLRSVAAQMRAAGEKGLQREMAAGLRKAAKPIEAAITASAVDTMPKAGGYAQLLSASLRHRTSVRTAAGRSASVRVTTYADGTKERRDVRRLEKGELRHPVWGRYRKRKVGRPTPNPWTTTKIRPGFHRRGTDKAADLAENEMENVLADYAARLAGG